MRNRSTPTSIYRTFRFAATVTASRTARVLTAAVAVCLLALALTAPVALAAPAAQDAPGESNLGYLLAGTLLTWAGFFVYAVFLWRKNRDLRREVDDLRRQLGEKE